MLPAQFGTSREYLTDVFDFLNTYQWLFNFTNTDILVCKVLDEFPKEWIRVFDTFSTDEEINSLVSGATNENYPDSLNNFLRKIKSLRSVVLKKSYNEEYKICHNSGLGRKKLHEITALAPLVNEICIKNGIRKIVDVGAGLGYLSHLLHDKYNYAVLGIEGDGDKVKSAYKNQERFYRNSKNQVDFIEHFITERSAETMKSYIGEHFGSDEVCLVGLHACADLSITILDLFTKIEGIKSLVIMPCCYHRIELLLESDLKRDYFKHFPASGLVSELFQEFDAGTFIGRPFLRLACQESVDGFVRMTREEHEEHARRCLYRAILQDVAAEENCAVKRIKRKSGKWNSKNPSDFDTYLSNLPNTHKLEKLSPSDSAPLQINDERFASRMHEKWNEHKSDCSLVEVLTGLQAALQSVCENVVLLDRVEFLREKGFDCFVEKVTDERISPRCFALVAARRPN